MMKGQTQVQLLSKKIGFAGLYMRNLGANLAGFLTIFLLNFFTPLDFFKIQKALIFHEGGWPVFFSLYP